MTDPALDPRIDALHRDRYHGELRLSRTAHGRLEFLRWQLD